MSHWLGKRLLHQARRGAAPSRPRWGIDGMTLTCGALATLFWVASWSHAQTVPKRLSDWMLEQPFTPNAYTAGLSWRVPDEIPAQHALRQEIVQYLSSTHRDPEADVQARQRFGAWLRSLPLTGRVLVPHADARWLQANPVRDPILRPGHSVVLPQRVSTVTVIHGDGTRCAITHVPSHEAKAYLEACHIADADWAWIAQPDGQIQRFGIAAWNRETQDEPAPGAWIWGPPRNAGWTARFSEQLITFLATQGPAPDHPQTPPRSGGNDTTDTPKALALALATAGGAAQGHRSQASGTDTLAATVTTSLQGKPGEMPPQAAKSRNSEASSSDWGSVGLLQTPTARMHNAGHFSFSFSRTQPYTRGNIFFQPFDWLEAGFRYIDISNRLYGPAAFSGDQSLKDKSIDLKALIWPESAYIPQLAIGVRDAAGTGLFSGEYIVANKRTDTLDWSLGLNWGYFAGQSRNAATVGQGGQFSVKNYFQGVAKPFAGVQYQTPSDKITLKLEYDSNHYQNEPHANHQSRTSPWNFGVVYKVAKSVDMTLGVERGNSLVLGLALHTQLDGLSTPKISDPPRVPVVAERPLQPQPDWAATTRAIQLQTGWQVRSIEGRNRELQLQLDNASATYWRDQVDKIAAVLHRDAPASVDRFVLRYSTRSIALAEHVIDRDAWVRPHTEPVPPREQQNTVLARAPVTRDEPAPLLHLNPRLKFEHNLRFGYGQTLGGPDGFILFQLYAQEQARLWLRDDTWLDGNLRLRLIDNYNKFKQVGSSELPRTRTYLREYLTTSAVTIPNLQITHAGKLTDNQYYSVYGGYLEEVFAGVGGEWLYRPFASRLAYSIDANYVKQRDFRQDFGFRDAGTQTGYRTATGHATAYWDTGWNDVLASVSVGRYLAKDTGATVKVSRTFQNGVTLGAFASKTSASAEQFGEGSFDKGIFLGIPLDAMLARSTATNASWLWRPLTRDGGALLARSNTLYGMTRVRSNRALEIQPAPLSNETLPPADHSQKWAPKPSGPAPYTRVTPRPSAAEFTPDATHPFRMTEALYRQGYRNITINYNASNQLIIALSNDSIAPVSRAVARAVRTALLLAPLETREIKVTFAVRTDPVVTYEFFDPERLNRYFNGALDVTELAHYVAVNVINPAARQNNPLEHFDDMDTEAKASIFSTVIPETVSAQRVANDFTHAGRTALDMHWLQLGVVGASTLLVSSALDKRAFQYAKDHQNNHWLKNGTTVGNALPWVGLAGAALVALDGSDPKRSRSGFAAAEAGASALLLSTGLKYAFGRARPEEGLGHRSFNAFSAGNNDSAFPSRHASVAWAIATPFALAYDAPWIYGFSALTTLARVGSREHWASDAVAGSLLGYGLGRIFWESSRADGKNNMPRAALSRNGVSLAWTLH